jgi:hypothetical protein
MADPYVERPKRSEPLGKSPKRERKGFFAQVQSDAKR